MSGGWLGALPAAATLCRVLPQPASESRPLRAGASSLLTAVTCVLSAECCVVCADEITHATHGALGATVVSQDATIRSLWTVVGVDLPWPVGSAQPSHSAEASREVTSFTFSTHKYHIVKACIPRIRILR